MPGPDDIEEDLHAFALYELATDDFEPYLMVQARREEETDPQRARDLYVKLRVRQLKETLDDPSESAEEILPQSYLQWRREAERNLLGLGPEWHAIEEQMKAHPDYGNILRDTSRGMAKQAAIIAAMLVLIVLVIFIVGSLNPTLAVGIAVAFLITFWLVFGLLPMIRRKD